MLVQCYNASSCQAECQVKAWTGLNCFWPESHPTTHATWPRGKITPIDSIHNLDAVLYHLMGAPMGGQGQFKPNWSDRDIGNMAMALEDKSWGRE